MDRYRISNLKWNDRVRIIIVFICASIFIDAEFDYRISAFRYIHQFKIISPRIQFIDRTIQFDFEPNFQFLCGNTYNTPLRIVVNQWREAV